MAYAVHDAILPSHPISPAGTYLQPVTFGRKQEAVRRHPRSRLGVVCVLVAITLAH